MRKLILLIFGVLALVFNASSQSIIDNIKLKNTEGQRIALDTLAKDKVVVICFWSTSCKPCQSELDALSKIEKEWKDKIIILAVSIDDSRSVSKVKTMAKGKKWPFMMLLDQTKELYRLFNLTQIPTAIVIDKDGKVGYQHTGYMPGNEKTLIDEAIKCLSK